MTQSQTKPANNSVEVVTEADETEVAYLAKRHRVSPAVVREIIRSTGSSERAAIEREIARGKARR